MKKLTVILTAALLLVGLGSCKKDPAATSLKLDPTSVTLKVGETQQLTATVKPDKAAVTYSSDKPEVATVDKNGLITAVAVGKATISATAGTLTRKCAVTVTDGKGGGVATQNELPLLKFDLKQNDPDVLAHEKKLEREYQDGALKLGSQSFPGFVNDALTIPVAVYGLALKSGVKLHIALSKETLADCPKTLAMLAEYGFSAIEDNKFEDGTPVKIGQKSDDPSVGVLLLDDPNATYGTTLQIRLMKVPEKKDLPTAHAIIADATDFPSWKEFKTADVAKVKEFETKLDLREFKEDKEDPKNLLFITKKASLDKSNFMAVYYCFEPTKGTPFINSQVNFIKNGKDFEDPKLKEWFTANGYGTKFQASAEQRAAMGYDATGKIVAQVFIQDLKDGSVVFLQIFESTKKQSAVQMRRLAVKQYEMMQTRTLLEGLEGQVLQQVVIR